MFSRSCPSSELQHWLRARLRGERIPWPGCDQDELMEMARYEGVVALLEQRVREDGAANDLPPTLCESLQVAAREQVATELLRKREIERVTAALGEAGLPCLLLKGSSLAYDLYPEPHLRPRCDMDVLFRDTDAVARCQPVLEALGYHASEVPLSTTMSFEIGFHRVTAGGNTQAVDVHWAAVNSPLYAKCLPFDELLAASVPLPMLGSHARGLGTLHALVLACVHRVRNLPSGDADRLIWLYDIHLLAGRMGEGDWQQLLSLAKRRGTGGACWSGLRATHAAFATTVPQAVMDGLRASANNERFDVSKAHRRTYQEWHNLRALPTGQRLRWLLEVAFPARAYMRELFPKQGQAALLRSHAQRWRNGLAQLLHGASH